MDPRKTRIIFSKTRTQRMSQYKNRGRSGIQFDQSAGQDGSQGFSQQQIIRGPQQQQQQQQQMRGQNTKFASRPSQQPFYQQPQQNQQSQQAMPIINRNSGYYSAAPQGPQFDQYGQRGYQENGQNYQQQGSSVPILPPLEQQSRLRMQPRQVQQQPTIFPVIMSGRGMQHNTQIISQPSQHPRLYLRHELMHIDHSERSESRAHNQYPEHMTTVRIRTPSQWGSSRIATPVEVRSTMSTIERYRLNPPKSITTHEYEPYSNSDYRNLNSRYQNMKLPRGLGPTDDERWQNEVLFLFLISA